MASKNNSSYSQRVFIESLVIGLVTSFVGLAVSTPWMRLDDGKWPNAHILLSVGASLFVTGVVIHLGMEVSGLNRWYCKNGAACAY